MRFRYSVAQYVPSLVRGEGLNLGVLIEDEDGRVAARFLGALSRIRAVYPDADVATVRLLRENLVREYPTEEGILLFGDDSPNLDELVQTYQNTLCLSTPRVTLGSSMAAELDELYQRFVAPPEKLAPRPISALTVAPAQFRRRLSGWLEQRHLVGPEKYRRNVEIAGRVYSWTFDFGIRNGRTTVVQSVSLKGSLDEAMNRAALLGARAADVGEASDGAIDVVAVADDPTAHEQPVRHLEHHNIEVLAMADSDGLSDRLSRPLAAHQ